MDTIFAKFQEASTAGHENGNLLASTLTPEAPPNNPGWLYEIAKSSNEATIANDVRYGTVYNSSLGLSKAEGQAWQSVFLAFWQTVKHVTMAEELTNQGNVQDAPWKTVYTSWKEVVDALVQGYSKDVFEIWTIPCLYVAGKYLRVFAIKADKQLAQNKGPARYNGFGDEPSGDTKDHQTLEDAASQITRIFSLCLSDRSPIYSSRKWAIYYTTNLLFKIYFEINAINLSKSILRSLNATTTDTPPLESFPKSHIVTFKYYVGVISFLDEDYAQAEEHLSHALRLCPKSSTRHRELILTYLIPCHLLLSRTLPSAQLLSPYPKLQRLFSPLSKCIKRGDLAGFDAALSSGQDEFVKRRIYLTLERGRDVCLRNTFRKVFLAAGFDEAKDGAAPMRRTRIRVDEFWAGLRVSMREEESADLDRDEVECLIANCIYKNLMKGYISRQHGMVVLSKGGAFPGTGI